MIDLPGQLLLQKRVALSLLGEGVEVGAKVDVAGDIRMSILEDMGMVGADGVSPFPEIAPTRNAVFAAWIIAQADQAWVQPVDLFDIAHNGQNVDDWLGVDADDGCAAVSRKIRSSPSGSRWYAMVRSAMSTIPASSKLSVSVAISTFVDKRWHGKTAVVMRGCLREHELPIERGHRDVWPERQRCKQDV